MKHALLLLLWGFVGQLLVAQDLRSQAAIAADLRSSETETISKAISDTHRIPKEQRNAELRQAILYALEAEYRRDEEARLAGVNRFYDEPLTFLLADLAIELQDPAVIPTLVLVAETNSDIAKALAAFGRLALPIAVQAARGFDPGRAVRCIVALRYMVEEWGIGHFTAAERAELKSLVASYLEPGQPVIRTGEPGISGPNRVRHAAMLALVLEDEEAHGWVERLISDEVAFIERLPTKEAVLIPQTITQIQGYLDGTPFLPAHRPLSEFRERYGWTEY